MLTPARLARITPFDLNMLMCWERFALLRPIFSINSLAVISLSLNVLRISNRLALEKTLQTSAWSSKICSIYPPYLDLKAKAFCGQASMQKPHFKQSHSGIMAASAFWGRYFHRWIWMGHTGSHFLHSGHCEG